MKFSSTTLLDESYYQITFKAMTSNGLGEANADAVEHLYEVTFEHNDSGIFSGFSNSYKLVSDIIRLDKSSRKRCSVDNDVLQYCSCKKE